MDRADSENDNVPALNRFQPVDKFVNEDAFLIFERRHHADAFDFYRLVEKDDDEGRNRKRDDQVAQPYAEPDAAPEWAASDRALPLNRRQDSVASWEAQAFVPIVYRRGWRDSS